MDLISNEEEEVKQLIHESVLPVIQPCKTLSLCCPAYSDSIRTVRKNAIMSLFNHTRIAKDDFSMDFNRQTWIWILDIHLFDPAFLKIIIPKYKYEQGNKVCCNP